MVISDEVKIGVTMYLFGTYFLSYIVYVVYSCYGLQLVSQERKFRSGIWILILKNFNIEEFKFYKNFISYAQKLTNQAMCCSQNEIIRYKNPATVRFTVIF